MPEPQQFCSIRRRSLLCCNVSVRNKKVPQRIEMLALVLAVGGTFLLATHGNITNLAISTETLVWGLASAVAMALYNLIPEN